MVPGSPPLLCGKVSRDIKQELDKLTSEARVKKLRWFSDCFSVTALILLIQVKLLFVVYFMQTEINKVLKGDTTQQKKTTTQITT